MPAGTWAESRDRIHEIATLLTEGRLPPGTLLAPEEQPRLGLTY